MTRLANLLPFSTLICSIGMVVSAGAVAAPPREPTPRECDACRAVMKFVGEAIVSPLPMDRGGAIIEKYLAVLDPRHVYFLEGDVRRFREQSRDLERQLKAGELSIAYEVFALYRERLHERTAHVITFLSTEFDDPNSAVELSASCAGYCDSSTQAEARLMSQLLVELARNRLPDETFASHKRRVAERYRRLARSIESFEHDDLLEVFLNAVVKTYDPHAEYLSDKTLSRFNT